MSVIIPTYRRRELLRAAVESALRQTVSEIEVVVVEDGSRIAAEALAGCPPCVRHVWQPHQGVSVARNVGAHRSTAEWLAVLDDDDLWEPDKLECQLVHLARKPQLAMVHTDHRVLIQGTLRPGRRSVPRESVPSGMVGRALFLDNFVILSSVLIRKTIFEQVGGFAPGFCVAADYDLWLRLSRQHQIGFLDEPLTIYRDHESMSSDSPRAALECALALATHASAFPSIATEYGPGAVRKRIGAAYWQAAYAHYLAGRYPSACCLSLVAWRWQPGRTAGVLAASLARLARGGPPRGAPGRGR